MQHHCFLSDHPHCTLMHGGKQRTAGALVSERGTIIRHELWRRVIRLVRGCLLVVGFIGCIRPSCAPNVSLTLKLLVHEFYIRRLFQTLSQVSHFEWHDQKIFLLISAEISSHSGYFPMKNYSVHIHQLCL